MKFHGYRISFRINLLHSVTFSEQAQEPHPHTLELSLYINKDETAFISFEDIEKIVENYLTQFEGVYLNDTESFANINPTIENIAAVFNQEFSRILSEHEFYLTKLEISEAPSRLYIIDNHLDNPKVKQTAREQKLLIVIEQMKQHLATKPPRGFAATSHLQKNKAITSTKIEDSVATISKPIRQEEADLIPPIKMFPLKLTVTILFLLTCSIGLMWYVKESGHFPLGTDIYGHLYKSDFLYSSIQNGDFYPLYSAEWYNGLQPFRYWAPIPYYIMAFLQWIAGGDVINGFILYIGFSFLVGALGWILWGIKERRILLCTFFSFLWFFFPDNLRVFFSEGNLPRMTVTIMLPYIFYFIWNFVIRKEKGKLVPIILLMTLITLTHAMIAAMVGVGTFIFLLIYAIINKKIKYPIYCLCGMLSGIFISGIWLIPGLVGGIMSTDSGSITSMLFTDISTSLNPILRFDSIGEFYYGLAVILISILGIIAASKKSVPGFINAIIIFLGTTTLLAPLVTLLPLSDLLWFRRFTPIAYALFIASMIAWKKCRKPVMVLLCCLLVADSIPSFQLKAFHESMPASVGYETQEEVASEYLFDQAKELTNQRISLMDLSSFGPFPSYYIPTPEPKIDYTFGWAWQGATTGPNIVKLNTALEESQFLYLFDRNLELGNDTVIVAKAFVKNGSEGLTKLKYSAKAIGYQVIDETDTTILFHMETPECFGLITHYSALAIGNSAKEISMQFPAFEEGRSNNLEDYTLEELTTYEKLYLSDFTYTNKANAEELLKAVSHSGTKVYIDMNRIPINPTTRRTEFLGVNAQPISFEGDFPEIYYKNQLIEGGDFPSEYNPWNTVYLDNLDSSSAFSWFADQQLSVIGTKHNDNLVFLGYNLFYYATETRDENISKLIKEIMNISESSLPKREIVPIQIDITKNRITIQSDFDNVNTTLASLDSFQSLQTTKTANNLLYVNQGETIITFSYPYFKHGLIVSILGLLSSIFIILFLFHKSKIHRLNNI